MSHPRVLLDRLGASARKSLSQNFLTSPHWADTLVGAVLDGPPADEIWEIGPGLGALTSVLLARAGKPVRAFEFDRKLSHYLRETYPKLTLIEGDVLDADFAATSPGAKQIAVLSNLPYHLSSPILFKLAAVKQRITRVVLTFQREFAQRLTAAPRTPDYGGLTVTAHRHFKSTSLGIIPPGAFYPPPAVASEALLLTPILGTDPAADALLEKVVRAAFAHRRKKLSSNLKEAFPTAPAADVLAELGHGPAVRPEELDPNAYDALAARLSPYIA